MLHMIAVVIALTLQHAHTIRVLHLFDVLNAGQQQVYLQCLIYLFLKDGV